MYQINPISEKQLESYQNIWEQDKILTIPNFLHPKDAKTLYEYLSNLKEEEWDISICPAIHSNIYTYYNTKENQPMLHEGIQKAKEAYKEGEFSYYFYRKDDYSKDGIKFKDLAKSEELLGLINRITGCEVNETISLFASRYVNDCFLSSHTDTGRGKIAFVYNLTKNWKEKYGGLLLHPNKMVVPTFNSLAMFYVEGDGVPHSVTQISPYCENVRLAFTGWFN